MARNGCSTDWRFFTFCGWRSVVAFQGDLDRPSRLGVISWAILKPGPYVRGTIQVQDLKTSSLEVQFLPAAMF